MTHIHVSNRQRSFNLKIKWLENLSTLALADCLKRPALKGAVLSKLETVEAVIVSDRVMAAVHKRFLNERGPTDVITFDHGEILIGVQTARTNAAKYKNPLTVEIGLYIIHGLLHLHGYTDLQKTEAKMMEKMQASILNACLKRLKED